MHALSKQGWRACPASGRWVRSRRKSFPAGIALLRVTLGVRNRKNHTNQDYTERFAFCTRFLPPMWSGQAVVIGRLLAGLPPEVYCLATQPVYGDRRAHDFIGALPGTYYDLPPEKRLPAGRFSKLVRGEPVTGASCSAASRWRGRSGTIPSTR
jgi:hypothetical protein